MRFQLRIIPVLLLLLAVSGACVKPQAEIVPEPPEGFEDLLQAYSTGQRWTAISQGGGMLTIDFYKWQTVSINSSTFVTEDCTDIEPGITGINMNGNWMVRGKDTGIRRTVSQKEPSVPVYIFWNASNLTVCTSDGDRFSLEYVDPELAARIPVVNITTYGGKPITSKEDYVDGSLAISNPDNKYGFKDGFAAEMKIRGRGNSTWDMPKKPWKIKFNDKQCLFNMSTDKEWCLLANYTDKTLVRNIVAMELSRICGFKWTPRMVSVEVNLNGKYQGVYTFCEHKKVSKERVNIDTDNGDILFEIDEQQDENVCWWTELGVPVMFSDPSEPSAEQVSKAKQTFKDFEAALKSEDYSALERCADLESLANYFIIQELTKNIDGNLRRSSFITLEDGGRLEMYHVWDFDLSQGNADYYGTPPGKTAKGWWVKDYGAQGKNSGWYWRLFKLESFRKLVQSRWNELYPRFLEIPDYIDRQSALIGTDAILRDEKAWPYSQYRSVNWWNASHSFVDYETELSYYRKFYSERLEWMNTEINAL